jgi:hypothetical protein
LKKANPNSSAVASQNKDLTTTIKSNLSKATLECQNNRIGPSLIAQFAQRTPNVSPMQFLCNVSIVSMTKNIVNFSDNTYDFGLKIYGAQAPWWKYGSLLARCSNETSHKRSSKQPHTLVIIDLQFKCQRLKKQNTSSSKQSQSS